MTHASVEDTIVKGTELIITDLFSVDQFSSCCAHTSEPELEPVFTFQDFVFWTSISRAAVSSGCFEISCCDAERRCEVLPLQLLLVTLLQASTTNFKLSSDVIQPFFKFSRLALTQAW